MGISGENLYNPIELRENGEDCKCENVRERNKEEKDCLWKVTLKTQMVKKSLTLDMQIIPFKSKN